MDDGWMEESPRNPIIQCFFGLTHTYSIMIHIYIYAYIYAYVLFIMYSIYNVIYIIVVYIVYPYPPSNYLTYMDNSAFIDHLLEKPRVFPNNANVQ